MLLIQIITGNVKSFAESLEVYDFPFSQETQRRQNSRVFCQIDEVFVSRPGFLFYCTFISVTCYVKLWKCVMWLFCYIRYFLKSVVVNHASNNLDYPYNLAAFILEW